MIVAGTLGILPNHLIQLIRLHDPKNLKKIVNDLRVATSWSAYNIWAKHQTLSRTFWKILTTCCKPAVKEKKSNPLGKKRKRRTKKLVSEDCKNPFHYPLEKEYPTCSWNMQLQRSTFSQFKET